jgi:hypothetical protein
LEINPGLKEAALNFSAAELNSGSAQSSSEVLEKLLKMHPDYPPALGRMAAACILTGRQSEGVEYLDRLQKKGFDCAGTLEEQAQELMEVGKIESAARLLATAQESGFSNEKIDHLLGVCRQRPLTASGDGEQHNLPGSLPAGRPEASDLRPGCLACHENRIAAS